VNAAFAALRLSAPATLKRSGKPIAEAFGVKHRCSGERYHIRYAPVFAIFSDIALVRYPVRGAATLQRRCCPPSA
jgi:hypothetical protein